MRFSDSRVAMLTALETELYGARGHHLLILCKESLDASRQGVVLSPWPV